VAVLTLAEAEALARRAFERAGVSPGAAAATARALVAAERDGQKGHGLSRIPAYVDQARCGKVKGHAVAHVEQPRNSVVLVDAGYGYFYPAFEAAFASIVDAARTNGVAAAAFRRSHHCGQAGLHVERFAEQGLIAFIYANTPKAMAFWGGARAMIGTNPMAFATPMADGAPLVIDLALSVVARSRIVAAKSTGDAIPADWAFDSAGRPTTDAAEALEGSLAPLGGAKGAALALMVEILAAAVSGAQFGWEASSFLDAEGGPPDVGQLIVALDPAAFGPAFFARMSVLAGAMSEEPGVRQPGATRLKNRAKAEAEGLAVAPALLAKIRTLAGEGA
jgi:(2R)-3-sulfolactate dehydrogenase (NADP+)